MLKVYFGEKTASSHRAAQTGYPVKDETVNIWHPAQKSTPSESEILMEDLKLLEEKVEKTLQDILLRK